MALKTIAAQSNLSTTGLYEQIKVIAKKEVN